MTFLLTFSVWLSTTRPTLCSALTSKDEPLLVWRDSLLVLDLGLDVLDGVRGLDLEGDGLTREGLDEDLHFYL